MPLSDGCALVPYLLKAWKNSRRLLKAPSWLSGRSVRPLVSAKSCMCRHRYRTFLILGPSTHVSASRHNPTRTTQLNPIAHGSFAGEQRQQPNSAANTSASAPTPQQQHLGNASGQGQSAQPQPARGQSEHGRTADRMRSALLPIQASGNAQGKLLPTLPAQEQRVVFVSAFLVVCRMTYRGF